MRMPKLGWFLTVGAVSLVATALFVRPVEAGGGEVVTRAGVWPATRLARGLMPLRTALFQGGDFPARV